MPQRDCVKTGLLQSVRTMAGLSSKVQCCALFDGKGDGKLSTLDHNKACPLVDDIEYSGRQTCDPSGDPHAIAMRLPLKP